MEFRSACLAELVDAERKVAGVEQELLKARDCGDQDRQAVEIEYLLSPLLRYRAESLRERWVGQTRPHYAKGDDMSRGLKRLSYMLIFMVSLALSTWPLIVPTFAATRDPYYIRILGETKAIGLAIRIEDRATYLGTTAPLEIATALQAAAQRVLVRAIAVQSLAHEGVQIETPAVRLLALGDSYSFSPASRELIYLLDIVIDNDPDRSRGKIVSYYSTYGFYVTNAGLLSLQTADPVHTPNELGAFPAPRTAELVSTLAKELNIAGFLQLVVDRMFTEAAK